MSFARIVWRNSTRIIAAAHYAIVHGMLETWRLCPRPQEPDFVAGLAIDSTPVLYAALSSIFQRYGIQFSLVSVFCHQTPQVHYAGMQHRSCEIGDLLFVHVHRASGGSVTRNALLYQAKMSSSMPHIVAASQHDQLKLYVEWPTFDYTSPSLLSGQRRVVKPKLPHMGGQYLLIEKKPPYDPLSKLHGYPKKSPMDSCMPDEYLYAHNGMDFEFFDFLLLRSGKTFDDRSNISPLDGWSQIVWDLIDIGLNRVFSRRGRRIISSGRYTGGPIFLSNGLCFANKTSAFATTIINKVLGEDKTKELFAGGNEIPPNNKEPEDIIEDIQGGMSLILMETADYEDEQRRNDEGEVRHQG